MSKKQSPLFRLIAYPLLGAIFVVCAYFIAVSAMGYKYKYNDGKFEKIKTGAIILSSRPGDAAIFVNNRQFESNTPMFSFMNIQVNGLKPGDYDIRLEKTGYESWQGIFKVYPGLVSWGTQILLLPQERKAVGYNMPEAIETQIVSADKTRVLTVTHDKANEAMSVWQTSVTSKNRQLLFERRLGLEESYRPVTYSDDNQRILFERTSASAKNYLVIEANQNPREWEVTNTFKTSFDSYLFNPKNHDELICTRSGDMFRVNYVDKNMSGALFSGVKGTFLGNRDLLFIQTIEKNNSLNQLGNNNQKTLIIRDVPSAESYQVSYLSSAFGYTVIPASTKTLLLYPAGNPDAKPKAIADQVDFVLPSPKLQFLGFGRQGGFYCYELDKDRTFTTFQNRKVSSIVWFEDQFNLAYIENGKLKMITFAGFYDKNIFDAVNEHSVVASPDGPRLFFVAPNKNKKILDLFVFDYNS